MTTTIDVPEDEYREIGDLIHSAESPVGIDARHTHILILHLLRRIDGRLERLEEKARSSPAKSL